MANDMSQEVSNQQQSPMEASDVHRIAHATIADFLERNGYSSTLETFQNEASNKVGWKWNQKQQSTLNQIHLEDIVEKHQSILMGERNGKTNNPNQIHSQKSPLELTLAGPPTLPFHITKVYPNLHATNILSVSIVHLPIRTFSTSEAKYVHSIRNVICSTGADRNIIFSDPKDGEMVECYEGGQGQRESMSHGAAVLCTMQNPNKNYQREFVSCGMDSKVIIWDLLLGKPIQLLDNHSRFVVRCAFSSSGNYLATCSYDRTICIFKRTGGESDQHGTAQEENDDLITSPEMLKTRYELVHTIKTRNNPESIVFVRASLSPSPADPGTEGELQNQTQLSSNTSKVQERGRKRTWLAFTMRSDCFIHYVALPLDADYRIEETSTNGVKEDGDLSSKLEGLDIHGRNNGNDSTATPAWKQLSFNTNASRTDYHVSYSLLHITLHPLGNHIAIQTGDHSIPSTGYAPTSSSLSRILLMPLLSSERTATIWTGVASSGFAVNRHTWLPDGSAVWLTSEDGIVRLVDVHGKTRAKVHAHGVISENNQIMNSEEEMRSASSWSRGGNTIVKDIVVLDNSGSIASCGFDHTIRVISQNDL